MKYLFFIISIIFLGCANKININEFTPINAPKSKFLPSKNEILYKPQILITNFSGSYSNYAKDFLKITLSNIKSIKLLNRQFKSLKEEIKLSEIAKSNNSNLDQADFLIEGKIIEITKKRIYHPSQRFKDKKGRIYYTKAYYEHTVCVKGEISITKLPENIIYQTLPFYKCEYETTSSYYFDYKPLIIETIKSAIYNLNDKLKKIFAKKGYIFEIRKKDNDIIIKTTLNSNFGAKTDENVDIFTIKKIKIPFSNDYKKEILKIGEGKIIKVTNEYSWILVKKHLQTIKIGDFVKMNYKHSFWDIFE
ncbi:CsgG/HfaB family protein [Caminibacter mediatlanticus]|uniref:Uncharacterized protein n=1 Tax=Caminibacter mediatlanticus TB-2 TaxID=391592 RepID=A0AAI9AIU2_9BACT|nr:CsgG/HfaB family protein [Caminibacter mediatlanticus]EDM24458.1 hypothetical protein CMTB2_03043 [Caminibacter mediatlanticus TB-2]